MGMFLCVYGQKIGNPFGGRIGCKGQPRESDEKVGIQVCEPTSNPKVISIGPNLFNLSLNLGNLSVFQAMVCKSISSFSYAMQ